MREKESSGDGKREQDEEDEELANHAMNRSPTKTRQL
jgi:hypothetical protein